MRLAVAGPYGRLTNAEIVVLRYLGTDLTYSGIGAALHTAPRTARTHAERIMSKAGVHSRGAAVVWALAAGVITLDEIIDVWAAQCPHMVMDDNKG